MATFAETKKKKINVLSSRTFANIEMHANAKLIETAVLAAAEYDFLIIENVFLIRQL